MAATQPDLRVGAQFPQEFIEWANGHLSAEERAETRSEHLARFRRAHNPDGDPAERAQELAVLRRRRKRFVKRVRRSLSVRPASTSRVPRGRTQCTRARRSPSTSRTSRTNCPAGGDDPPPLPRLPLDDGGAS